MSVGNWIRKRLGLVNPQGWRWVSGDDTWAGESVGVDQALQVSAFFSGTRLKAQINGSLPCVLYERQADGGRAPLRDHELYSILHDTPNAEQTAAEFWESVSANLTIWGNSYAEKQTRPNGQVTALEPFIATEVAPYRNTAGHLKYKVTDRGKTYELPEDKMFHVRGFTLGGDLGLSTLGFARQSLGIARAGERAAGKVFSEGMRTRGFFLMPGTLDSEQRKQANKNLVEPFTGVNGKTLGILEADVKFQSVQINPEDAELLMSRRFSVEEVCRWLGIPPIMLGHASEGQTMWGTGVESLLTQFYTTGLRPDLVKQEKAISRSLIAAGERKRIYAEFNIDALLRGDLATRGAHLVSMVNNGIMDRNEARQKENLPKREGGDILTVQGGLVPLDQLRQTQQTRPAAEPPANARRLEVVR